MFKPTTALLHESLDQMKEKFEAERGKEFVAHVCVKRLGAPRQKTE
jgi:hypothetical protein